MGWKERGGAVEMRVRWLQWLQLPSFSRAAGLKYLSLCCSGSVVRASEVRVRGGYVRHLCLGPDYENDWSRARLAVGVYPRIGIPGQEYQDLGGSQAQVVGGITMETETSSTAGTGWQSAVGSSQLLVLGSSSGIADSGCWASLRGGWPGSPWVAPGPVVCPRVAVLPPDLMLTLLLRRPSPLLSSPPSPSARPRRRRHRGSTPAFFLLPMCLTELIDMTSISQVKINCGAARGAPRQPRRRKRATMQRAHARRARRWRCSICAFCSGVRIVRPSMSVCGETERATLPATWLGLVPPPGLVGRIVNLPNNGCIERERAGKASRPALPASAGTRQTLVTTSSRKCLTWVES